MNDLPSEVAIDRELSQRESPPPVSRRTRHIFWVMILTPLAGLALLHFAPPTSPRVTRIPCADGTFPNRIPLPEEPVFYAYNDGHVFIDASGNIVMRTTAFAADSFVGNFAPIQWDDPVSRIGFLSRNGDVLQIDGAENIEPPSENMVSFRVPANLFPNISWRYGFVDLENATVTIPPQYAGAGSFSEGLAQVNKGASNWNRGYITGGRWGFINRLGEEVIPLRFDAVGDFHEGFAAAAKGNKWGYIDTSGEWAIPPNYAQVDRFSEGLAVVRTTINGNPSYIDRTGKTIISARFAMARRFSEGLAHVSSSITSGADGFINRDGKIAIPLIHALARDFSEGVAGVCVGARTEKCMWGFIDSAGMIVIEPRFKYIGDFRGGIARVSVAVDGSRNETLYIDHTGNQVWPKTDSVGGN